MDVAPSPRGRLEVRELTTDVCVVGGGVAGLSVAYALACDGKRVLVLDDGPIGGGETGRTSAHLASYLDDRFVHLEKLFGAEGAALAYESHAAAIDWIETACARERIDCGFRRVDGYLFAGAGAAPGTIEDELAATLHAGLVGAELVSRAPFSAFDTGPAMRVPDQAQFHPLAYLAGLAVAIEQRGGVIATPHHVERIDERDGVVTIETTDGLRVNAGACVVATNAPITNAVGLPLKQAAYRTYAIAVVVQDGTLPSALYWDTEEPYHYVRVIEGADGSPTDLIVVGGEDHRTGQADDGAERWARLEAWTRDKLGGFLEVAARWSGQVMEPHDALGYIGLAHADSDAVYVVTGDSGHGLTHATIAAMILSDRIAGRENPWQKLYDPRRVSVRGAGAFASEAIASATPYADWLRPGDVSSSSEIAPGTGRVVRRGLSLVAAYRDAGGALHERSAVCKHLGGVVRWNAAEKSWDCPCHGSRFDALGGVIIGPANEDLDVIADEEDRESGERTTLKSAREVGSG